MKRRELLRSAVLAGAAASVGRLTIAQPPGRLPARPDKTRLIVDGLDVSTLNETYVGLLKRGGVDCWHKSVGGEVEGVGQVYRFVDDHSADLTIATTARQIREAYRSGKIAIVFGAQGSEFLEGNLKDLPGALRGHYQLGLRILGIAYNLPNAFGSGNFYPYMGLTPAGRKLVETVHQLNMIQDVGGHSGEQSSLDAIAIAPEIPVICSHTNVAAIADNPRCVTDRLIDAIAKTGGVIGLTAVNDFHVRKRGQLDVAHSPRVGIDAYIDQMDYLKKRVGADHIGIGPDFVEGWGIDYDATNRSTSINRAIISDGPWLYVQGFENISELPNVIRRMEARGWSKAEIDKVMGDNWLRVYQKVWGA